MCRGWATLLYADTDLDPEQVFIALPAQGGNQLAGTPGGVSADTAAADTELSDTATADTGVAADTAGAFFAARVDGAPLWP